MSIPLIRRARRFAGPVVPFVVGVLLWALVHPVPARAQEARSRDARAETVTGTVQRTLPSGGVAPLADVAVSSSLETVVTGPDGHFRIRVAPDAPTLSFTRLGYRAATREVGGDALRSGRLEPLTLEVQPILLQEITARAGDPSSGLAAGTSLAIGSLSEDRILELGASSVAEALAGMEGVSVSRVGAWGSRPVIRGVSGERLAILVDGNRLNRACTFGMDQGLATVDPATVERVEILSGPGSTVFGAGNTGGVINVVTRGPEPGVPWGGEARLGFSAGVPGARIGGTLRHAGAGYALSASVDGSNYGDYRTPEGSVDGSSFRDLSSDLKLDLTPWENHRVSLSGQLYAGRDIGWPMQPGAEIPEETRWSISGDYGWQVSGRWVDGVNVRGFHQKLDHYMTLTRPAATQTTFVDARSNSATTGIRAQARLMPVRALEMDVGVEGTRWAAEATRWMETTFAGDGSGPPREPMEMSFRTWPAVEITDLGAFAQAQFRLASWAVLSGGLRYDRVDRRAEDQPATDESLVTGNAGVSGSLPRGFSYRASLGRGYRVPDPTELFGVAPRPDGFLYVGNPELETETSTNLEGTLSWEGSRLRLGVTGFLNEFQNLIAPAPSGDTVSNRPVRRYENIRDAQIRGWSASMDLELPLALELGVTGSFTRGEDSASGDPLPAMPPLEGRLRLRKDVVFGVLRWIEGEVEAASEQDRVALNIGEPVTPGYAVLHLRSGMDLGRGRFTVGLENVLDESYRSHLDPMRLLRPGRNFFVRYAYRF